ncbi:PadR family transcriptional regulator [bacterium]|nr:PadR family transcriptional regulator [bacterium]NCQ55154.1 PadR family transcriptional regulator [Candidatus Parcubacteria bacterium]NCS67333.1 PadR family transcriptional regulator [Candidatus Peregrinibacteria bacterium]NCS96588.1 PadR family transcriptional regulator [bacterium]
MKEISNIENRQAQMRKGLLGYAVLLCIKNKEAYAATILANLKKADLLVVEGTLYPLLNRFKREGLLDYKWEESPSGPPRKYYALTDLGMSTLESLEDTWKGLCQSIKKLN